jgi:uncharacterized membrane protein
MVAWTLVFHVVGFVMWIGGLMIAMQVMMQHAEAATEDARRALGTLANKVMNSMALPGAVLTLASGAILIGTNPAYYLHARWLQLKVACVLILIVLHLVGASRAREVLAGRGAATRGEWLRLHIFISLVFLSIVIFVLPVAVNWR